jgi:hypothetical protein
MKKIILLSIIVLMAISAGCTSYFTNLTTPKHNLNLNESVTFEKEGNRFSAQIIQMEEKKSPSQKSEIIVTIKVKNTGNKPVSLMAYPRLSDGEGNQFPGDSIFMGMITPGGQVTDKSSILIPTDENYNSLKKSAALSLRFQDTKLIPYEGTWNIDISSL